MSDLISREALKEHKFIIPQGNIIGGMRCGKTRELIIKEYQKGWNDCIDAIIDNAPTVDITEEQAIDKLHKTGWLPMHDKEMTERPQGEWLKIGDIGLAYTCNKCGEVNVIPTKFCPNCGARMKGGAE